MIRCSLKYELDGYLELRASGHAEAAGGRAGYDLVCAAFTTLTRNFVMSVTALTGAKEEIIADEKGLLHYRWHNDWTSRGNGRFTLLVLLRSIQIGLETLAKDYPDHINLEFVLSELFSRTEVVKPPVETRDDIADQVDEESTQESTPTDAAPIADTKLEVEQEL